MTSSIPGSRYPLFLAALCCLAVMPATSAKAVCNPNGTANEVIGCIDEANAVMQKWLAAFYPKFLNSFSAQCQTQFPGGGSGGHSDRATCLQDKLKAEAARVGLPNK
jgi:hypothetical protein